jgi:hypothetical protein
MLFRKEYTKRNVLTATKSRDAAALRTKQLNNQGTGTILQEVESGQRPEYKDNSSRSPVEILRCAEWHAKVPLGIRRRTIKNSPSNSPSQQSERLPNRIVWWTVRRSGNVTTGSRHETTLRSVAGSATYVQAIAVAEAGIGARYISTTWAPVCKYSLRCSRPFPRSDQGNRYILISMDYFTKWQEAYAIPNQ